MVTTLVVFDSKYGNTKRVAEAIALAIGDAAAATARHVSEVRREDLAACSLLVIGCPTHRFRPTPALTGLLQQVPTGALEGTRAACFDTRVSEARMPAFLRFIVRLQGARAYAAAHLASELERRGATLAAEPAGFLVQGMEGPLDDGELERAERWARELTTTA
jgi:flavodoxin